MLFKFQTCFMYVQAGEITTTGTTDTTATTATTAATEDDDDDVGINSCFENILT